MSEKVKKPFYKRAWFIVLIVIIGLGTISTLGGDGESSGGGSSDSKKEEAKSFHVGEVVTVGDVEYKVNSVTTDSEVGGDYFTQTANGTYLIVNISVTNKGNEQLFVDSSLFNLIYGEKEYAADSTAGIYANDDASFFLENVNPDLTLTGNVVFDVTDEVISAEDLQLKVQTGSWGTETELIYLNK